MPELRIVVLATQDRMAYGASFEEALTNLLDRSFTFTPDAAVEISETGLDEPPPGAAPAATATGLPAALIQRASEALGDYQRFTSEGRMADAGQSLEDLRQALEELNLSSP